MKEKAKKYNIKRTFGMDVLLKLTKTKVHGLKVLECGGKYTFNISAEELSKAVYGTLVSYNICLLVN